MQACHAPAHNVAPLSVRYTGRGCHGPLFSAIARVVNLRSVFAVGAVAALVGLAAWLEYGQYATLNQHTARQEIAQLCAGLDDARDCPDQRATASRMGQDPWGDPYRCRAFPSGVLIYSLGEDRAIGGTDSDADIACERIGDAAQAPSARPCACTMGVSVSARLGADADPARTAR